MFTATTDVEFNTSEEKIKQDGRLLREQGNITPVHTATERDNAAKAARSMNNLPS